MPAQNKIRRITVKLKNPNPLFVNWITEWRDQAKANNSKMQFTLSTALSQIKKYPLPLNSGKDCIILKGFGNKLCDMLDKKLLEHKRNSGVNDITILDDPIDDIDLDKPKRKKPKTLKTNKTPPDKQKKSPKSPRDYLPVKRSGAYAILVTLLRKSQEASSPGSMTKAEIIEHGRELSDKSFVKPDPGSFYTAWSSMTTLISKKLVLRKGIPHKFSLTDDGETLAIKLFEQMDENDDPSAGIGRHTATDEFNRFTSASSSNYIKDNSSTSGYSSTTTCPSLSQVNFLNTANDVKKFTNVSGSISREYSSCTSTLSSSSSIAVYPSSSNLANKTKLSSNTCTISSASSKVTEEDSTSNSNSQTSSNFETIIFAPFTFDILLLVDTQETTGGPRKPSDDETIAELNKLKACYEVRHLKVGDFTWICRERTSKQELVLPYIAERKRMDDLGHSIKDGRFHEQKFRLKQCGIQNLMYLVESHGNNTYTGLPLSSLMQAATNTFIQDQFQLKFTQNHRHSMQYLAGFTAVLKTIYEKKTVMSCPKEDLTKIAVSDDLISLMTFKDFNKGASKSRSYTVKDMFVKQLLQLNGVSVEKALAIVELYPTPRLLKDEFDRLGPTKGEKLLSNIKYGALKRNMGPVISRSLYQLYTIQKLS